MRPIRSRPGIIRVQHRISQSIEAANSLAKRFLLPKRERTEPMFQLWVVRNSFPWTEVRSDRNRARPIHLCRAEIKLQAKQELASRVKAPQEASILAKAAETRFEVFLGDLFREQKGPAKRGARRSQS